jgi:hypothetical protein
MSVLYDDINISAQSRIQNRTTSSNKIALPSLP